MASCSSPNDAIRLKAAFIRHIKNECCVLHPCFGVQGSSGPAVELTADHLLASWTVQQALGGRAAQPRGHVGLSKDHISPSPALFIGNARVEHMFTNGVQDGNR